MRSTKHKSSSSSTRPRGGSTAGQTPPVGFLFVVNKLVIERPAQDTYHHLIPPVTVSGYSAEVPSRVMRYSNGEISEAVGYQWYRDANLPASGQLLCLDQMTGTWCTDTAGTVWQGQEYKTFGVAACNPLLPIMVADQDPLATNSTVSWELLRIFHPLREGPLAGVSQVATIDSQMGDGGAPVLYTAGSSPSWIPSLLPETYRSPFRGIPRSRGLGGELPIILGLMALSAPRDPIESIAHAEQVFLGGNGHSRKWQNGEWRGTSAPRGYPETAQDDPRAFLVKVFLDPQYPNTTPEVLRWFEWQNAVVREAPPSGSR